MKMLKTDTKSEQIIQYATTIKSCLKPGTCTSLFKSIVRAKQASRNLEIAQARVLPRCDGA